MSKQDYSIKQIVKYFREVSVVVIGVAVTLSLSYWIGINNEKRDMRLYLNAIKLELEDNYQVLEDATENYRATHAYSNYLRAHRKSELEKDSILAYSAVWYSAVSIDFKKNAFEMFKSSGVMRLIKDKELVLAIWNAYKELDNITDQSEFVMKEKWEEVKKEIFNIFNESKIDIIDMKHEVLKIIPMYNFHVMGVDIATMTMYENALKTTKETLEKLDKVLN